MSPLIFLERELLAESLPLQLKPGLHVDCVFYTPVLTETCRTTRLCQVFVKYVARHLSLEPDPGILL